jgi:hypothetical protein
MGAIPMRARIVGLILFCWCACGWGAPPSIIFERDAVPQALYAIGDIHGDVERLARLLTAVHLADGASWTGGRSVLVVTGDMVDKGPHSVAVLRLLSALHAAAPKAGGEVILLAGNHEAEFLAEPTGKKSAEFAKELKHAGLDVAHVAACEGDIGAFLCSLPFAARVGDWFFSHGGNTSGRTISELQSSIKDQMSKARYAAPELIGPTSILEARLVEGKKWFASPDERHLLETYASALGVHHMVRGHQHNDVEFSDGIVRATGEMFQRWGLLFLIDVGMSREIDDSEGSVLRIASGTAAAVCPDGKTTLLWSESQAMDRGRATPCR